MATHVIRLTDLPKDPDDYIRYCRKLELCITLDDVIRNLVILKPRKDNMDGRASLPAIMDDPDFPKFPATFAQAMIGAERQAFLERLKKHIVAARKYFDSIEDKRLAERAEVLVAKRMILESIYGGLRSCFVDDEELTARKVMQQMKTRFSPDQLPPQ